MVLRLLNTEEGFVYLLLHVWLKYEITRTVTKHISWPLDSRHSIWEAHVENMLTSCTVSLNLLTCTFSAFHVSFTLRQLNSQSFFSQWLCKIINTQEWCQALVFTQQVAGAWPGSVLLASLSSPLSTGIWTTVMVAAAGRRAGNRRNAMFSSTQWGSQPAAIPGTLRGELQVQGCEEPLMALPLQNTPPPSPYLTLMGCRRFHKYWSTLKDRGWC